MHDSPRVLHTLIGKTCFGVYGRPRNKIMQAFLRPKVDNISLGPGWVITNDIRVAQHVLLSNGGANLNENTKSLGGVYVTP